MKILDSELSTKVIRGRKKSSLDQSVWQRFDRLQKSVAPLRKGKRIRRGIYYGSRP
jgi:hypothetical protein